MHRERERGGRKGRAVIDAAQYLRIRYRYSVSFSHNGEGWVIQNGIQTKPRDIPPGTISYQRFMNKTSALVAFRRLAHTLEC